MIRSEPSAVAPAVAVRVWDLPTRLFHWALVGCVVGSFVSAKIGGEAMVWHFRFGYAVLTLLAFRVLWGFVGGRWSRFSSFVYAPRTLFGYLRGDAGVAHVDVGHTPLGALSVFAMLALLAVQVATGLVADDEIFIVGPLNRFVDGDNAVAATGWHAGYGQWGLVVLTALHVAAIAWYRWRHGRRLVGAMVGGDKRLAPGTPASDDNAARRLLALALLAACGSAVAWGVAVWG